MNMQSPEFIRSFEALARLKRILDVYPSFANLPDTIKNQIVSSDKWSADFTKLPERLMNYANAKTIKGEKLEVRTGVIYLAPASLSGRNVCPMAKLASCIDGCLNTAGRGQMQSVQIYRIRKTLFWFDHPDAFKALLAKEANKLIAYCEKRNLTPAIRPNGTSDIRWENHIWSLMVETSKRGVKWYDYTKIANRIIPDTSVYDLTFSYSGANPRYLQQVETAVQLGYRIAVVFRTRESIPAEFFGMPCVDGDDTDLRFLDPQGVVVALYAKGGAKTDRSGFVVDVQ